MEEKKYYYKTPLSSARGKKIQEFINKGKEAAAAAENLAKELGASGYTDRPGCLYPGVGIGSLVFKRYPGGKRYLSIGSKEYIPNMYREKGKEIAKRIMKLPDVSVRDFRIAFGIPIDKDRSPAWFVSSDEVVYLCSPYQLGEDYETASSTEFDIMKLGL